MARLRASEPVDPPLAGGECYFRDKTLMPGRGHPWSAHDHAVLTLVLHGRLDETFGQREQRCPTWELHYKPRGAVHCTAAGPDGVRMLLVGVRGAALEGLVPREADQPRLLGGGTRAAQALSQILQIEAALEARTVVARESLRRLFGVLAPPPVAGCSPDGEPPSWLSEVRERILADEGVPSRLSRLAAEFRVHPVYLARAFRKHYGCSVDESRRRARADRAVAKLVSEATPLCQIALDLGYADQSHFSREIRRETGWTPRRFRKIARSLSRLAAS